MGPFAALERFIERLFERPTARLFRARLQPVQVLRRVERAMESARRTTAEAVLVPEHVVVRLNPRDLAGFGDALDPLAAELADGAMRFVRAHAYHLQGRPVVDLVSDPAVPPGDPRVEARFEARSQRPPSIRAVTAVPPDGRPDLTGAVSERTMVLSPPAAPPLARLRVLEPHGGDRAILLRAGALAIGRGAENDLVLGDPLVSRRHARIQVRGGRLVLSDAGSRNGTRVNGAPIQEVAVGLGDEILLGDTRLIVEPPDV
jgi:hypothetical protein